MENIFIKIVGKRLEECAEADAVRFMADVSVVRRMRRSRGAAGRTSLFDYAADWKICIDGTYTVVHMCVCVCVCESKVYTTVHVCVPPSAASARCAGFCSALEFPKISMHFGLGDREQYCGFEESQGNVQEWRLARTRSCRVRENCIYICLPIWGIFGLVCHSAVFYWNSHTDATHSQAPHKSGR